MSVVQMTIEPHSLTACRGLVGSEWDVGSSLASPGGLVLASWSLAPRSCAVPKLAATQLGCDCGRSARRT